MTTYTKKYEVVKWNELDEKSVKKAEIKKTKLENQGYSLVNTVGGLFHFTLEYKKTDDHIKQELNRKIKEIFG